MLKVKVSNEIFVEWMTVGHTFLPARAIQGLPRGCELFRAEVGLNGELEAYLLSPHEVTKIRGGATIDFEQAIKEAQEIQVIYNKCKVEVSL